ncbi:hypothetical protein [Salipiger sp. PrR003]|uniref:deoxynucleotide monophosphate kinase family protein n=1 Tax=Salipiger sp. PrR003 TaxID=2706776 RepID=UPI0013DA1B13|nr:hypothetical protein [Salipiger sp. PrR003]NDV52913.1 hypothetical protein [Salipiger sp. PrR003]
MSAEVVALNGLQGAGKSTAADHFLAQGFVRVKMADTLKRMTEVILDEAGVETDDIWRLIEGSQADKMEPIASLRGTTCRHIMRVLGNEIRNLIYSDIWVEIACSKVRRHLEAGRKVVIDDIRYPNEIAMLQYMFGARLQTLKIEGADHDEKDFSDAHPSELPLPDAMFSHVLRNDGTVDQLHKALEHVHAAGLQNRPGLRITCGEALAPQMA